MTPLRLRQDVPIVGAILIFVLIIYFYLENIDVQTTMLNSRTMANRSRYPLRSIAGSSLLRNYATTEERPFDRGRIHAGGTNVGFDPVTVIGDDRFVEDRGQEDYSNCFATIQPIQKSVASDLVLVIELTNEDGDHYCSVMMESSKVQYYDVKGSDRHPHYHILGTLQFGSYMTRLKEKCAQEGVENFTLLTEEEVRSGYRTDRCVIILRGDKDYDLDEVVVRNNIHLHDVIGSIVAQYPAEYFARILFGDETSGKSKDNNSRGNKRLDAGFTGTNSTDGETVPGMNLPGLMTRNMKHPGFGSDASREVTIYKGGCLVLQIHDYFRRQMSDNATMSEETFQDPDWWSRFTHRWANQVGLLEDQAVCSFCRFTGTSVIGCGADSNSNIIKTNHHRDNMNSKEKGHDHSPTLMIQLELTRDDGTTEHYRIGQNVYEKDACGMHMLKERVCNKIKKGILPFLSESFSMEAVHALHLKFLICDIRREGNMVNLHDEDGGHHLEAWVYPEDSDKDGYYSLMVNVILDISGRYGSSKWLMMEMLLTLALNPCPLRWAISCYKAARLMEERNRSQRTRRGIVEKTNFFCCFVDVQLEQFGTVSGGRMYERCQISHRRSHKMSDIWLSLNNMKDCIVYANGLQSKTNKILSKMTSKPGDGGCVGVGLFWSQMMVNLMAKLKLITNAEHASCPVVSPTTTTYKRLLMEGVVNPTHARILVGWLSKELDRPMDKCEQALCMMLRDKYGNSGTYDCFVRGHKLYKIHEGEVVTYDAGQRRMVIAQHEPSDGTYTATCKWWDEGYSVDETILYLKSPTSGKKKRKMG